jgi:hypothetical protein
MPNRSYLQQVVGGGRGPFVLSPPRHLFRPATSPIEAAEVSPTIETKATAVQPVPAQRSPADVAVPGRPQPVDTARNEPAGRPVELGAGLVIRGVTVPSELPTPTSRSAHRPSQAPIEGPAAPAPVADHPPTPETLEARPSLPSPADLPVVPQPLMIHPVQDEPPAIAPVLVPRGHTALEPPALTAEPVHDEARPLAPAPAEPKAQALAPPLTEPKARPLGPSSAEPKARPSGPAPAEPKARPSSPAPAEARPFARAPAEAQPMEPAPARIPGSRTAPATAPSAVTGKSVEADVQGLPLDPVPRTIAAPAPRTVTPEPIPTESHTEGPRLRPVDAAVGARLERRRADETASITPAGNTGPRERPRAVESEVRPIRLEPPTVAPRPVRPDRMERAASVRIGSLEVRITSPDARRAPSISMADAPGPLVRKAPAVPPAAPLSRGFRSFGLVQG